MKKTVTIGIPIQSIKHLNITYNEEETLEQAEPLFKIHRFSVRKIRIVSNGFYNPVHCYHIAGILPMEKIVLCLKEDWKGNIKQICSSRSLKMDAELASYIIKAVSLKLSENFDFKLLKS